MATEGQIAQKKCIGPKIVKLIQNGRSKKALPVQRFVIGSFEKVHFKIRLIGIILREPADGIRTRC
jgi:hypothetical protein